MRLRCGNYIRVWNLRVRYSRARLIRAKNGIFCVAVARGRTRTRIRRIRGGPCIIVQLEPKVLKLLIKASVLLNDAAILLCRVKD